MKRRTLLTGLGTALAAGLAGCAADGHQATPDPVDSDGPAIYRDSPFYEGASLSASSPPTLRISVDPSQNVALEDGYLPADYIAVLDDGDRVAYTEAVMQQTEYDFQLPSFGTYTVVAAGEHEEDSEESFVAERIAVLNVNEDGVVLDELKKVKRTY